MSITKFIHVMCGVLFSGILLTNYLYIGNVLRRNSLPLLQSALTTTLKIDRWLACLVPLLFISGSLLVVTKHYSFVTPWINAAYILLSLSAICWALLIFIKRKNQQALKRGQYSQFYAKPLFHLSHLSIIAFTFLIIHDAVMKHTL